MDVLVPFDPAEPKGRLAPVLDASERQALAAAMLSDVLGAIEASGHTPVVLTPARGSLPRSCAVVRDQQALSAAVTTQLQGRLAGDADAVALIMADCALVTPQAVERLVCTPGAVVLAPGRGGGTNGLVVRDPAFSTDFHGVSLTDHRQLAHALGDAPVEVDSMRLATDIDEPEDLPELLLHTEGEAARLLRSWGCSLTRTDGRVAMGR